VRGWNAKVARGWKRCAAPEAVEDSVNFIYWQTGCQARSNFGNASVTKPKAFAENSEDEKFRTEAVTM
jgi:hypothetical protein